MSTSTSNCKSAHAAAGRFASTQWSLALAAGRHSTPEAEQALAKLCDAYWPPIYAYLRRRGYLAPEAEDLTQSFFVRLLEKNHPRRRARAFEKIACKQTPTSLLNRAFAAILPFQLL